MHLDDLSGQAGEWLKGEGPESDIIISSRIRLARNLADYPFTNRATPEQKLEIAETLSTQIAGLKSAGPLTYFDLKSLAPLDLEFLVELRTHATHFTGH